MKMMYGVISRDGKTFNDVGIYSDGTLHNPNGYPDDEVRAVFLKVEAERQERIRERRARGAKKAVETRKQRREKKIYEVVKRMMADDPIGRGFCCAICGRLLEDPQSRERGIGPECWQDIIGLVEAARPLRPPA